MLTKHCCGYSSGPGFQAHGHVATDLLKNPPPSRGASARGYFPLGQAVIFPQWISGSTTTRCVDSRIPSRLHCLADGEAQMPRAQRSKYEGLNTSDRNRARIQRTGRTPSGHHLWTDRENDILKKYWPDYSKLRRLLRRRTRGAMEAPACALKITRPRQAWTTKELSALRRRWRDAPRDELMAELPRHTWASIRTKGNKLGIRRLPWCPKPTGKPLLDQIRRRAADQKRSMSELDRICSCPGYFQNSTCRPEWSRRRNILLRAIEELGGRVEIVWE